eukprot:TRINITY_DN2044_c0_g1_i1.p2 TRINITY_DN2044_c0_g1~~TRINITY_DN2044_c0_g1_i1.p2  ORF type:complete len:110 (+),score=34.35 TRINITY_DN2044_c0_g1_i1:320-649(+)
MGRKGIKQKHTAKEINAKHAAAKHAAGAAGGGASGAAKREQAKARAMVVCDICKVAQPNISAMTKHYESKHTSDWTPDVQAGYTSRYDEIRNAIRNDRAAVGKGKGKKK